MEGPVVHVDFAPTDQYRAAYGEEEARRAGDLYSRASGVRHLAEDRCDETCPDCTHPPGTKFVDIEEQILYSAIICGGVFLAGVGVGYLLWR